MPMCIHCGHDVAQCQCRTNTEDVFFAVDSMHRYKPEETEPNKDESFDKEDPFEEDCDFDYLDFNNDWED